MFTETLMNIFCFDDCWVHVYPLKPFHNICSYTPGGWHAYSQCASWHYHTGWHTNNPNTATSHRQDFPFWTGSQFHLQVQIISWDIWFDEKFKTALNIVTSSFIFMVSVHVYIKWIGSLKGSVAYLTSIELSLNMFALDMTIKIGWLQAAVLTISTSPCLVDFNHFRLNLCFQIPI